MSKAILIIINIIGFLYLTIFNIKKTEITHNGPKQIKIGKKLEVNIIIKKNDFSGHCIKIAWSYSSWNRHFSILWNNECNIGLCYRNSLAYYTFTISI